MHTAATDGISGNSGSGRRALAASERTLPGVSEPSRVVRSTIEIARSMAVRLAPALMDRVASAAARDSTPTGSTPGRPCRKRRIDDSSAVTSLSSAGSTGAGTRRCGGALLIYAILGARPSPVGCPWSPRTQQKVSQRMPAPHEIPSGLDVVVVDHPL